MLSDNIKQELKHLSSGVELGFRGQDGRFEPSGDGHKWIRFDEPQDLVYWNPLLDQVATMDGRAFALGEQQILNAASYALDDCLVIHASVSSWVLAGGRGIYVLDWRRAFDKFRDAARLAVPDTLMPIYRRAMTPRLPQVKVIRTEQARRNAA